MIQINYSSYFWNLFIGSGENNCTQHEGPADCEKLSRCWKSTKIPSFIPQALLRMESPHRGHSSLITDGLTKWARKLAWITIWRETSKDTSQLSTVRLMGARKRIWIEENDWSPWNFGRGWRVFSSLSLVELSICGKWTGSIKRRTHDEDRTWVDVVAHSDLCKHPFQSRPVFFKLGVVYFILFLIQ